MNMNMNKINLASFGMVVFFMSQIAHAVPKEIVSEAREIVVNKPEDAEYVCFQGGGHAYPTPTMAILQKVGSRFANTKIEDIVFNAGLQGDCAHINKEFLSALPLKLRIIRTITEECEKNLNGETLLIVMDQLKADVGNLQFSWKAEVIVGRTAPENCPR
jgi:hypothetical protein